MAKYICKICGREFDRIGNAVYCPGPHYRPCPVCGKPVEYKRPSDPIKCCSAQCSAIQAERSRSEATRICKECGKPFHPKQGSQVYCDGPHITYCKTCGKEIEYTCSPNEKPTYCSRECRTQGKRNTVESRYGVDNVSKIADVRDKISKANSSDDVLEHRRQTCLDKYGVDNVSKSDVVKQKIVDFMQSGEFKTKAKETSIEHYGVAHPMQSEEVKSVRQQTMLDRYGALRAPISVSQLADQITDKSKIDDYIEFKDDPEAYIAKTFDHAPKIVELTACLGVTDTPVYEILVEHNCSHLLDRSISNMESEVIGAIKNICPNIQIIHNDRTQIKPLEIDIYLPEYKLGIECNPTITHNASFADPWGNPPKHYKYHQHKSELAAAAGIFLFQLFSYEWYQHKDIVLSMLRNLLHVNETKIGARKTYVCEVSVREAKQFLNANHRQGYAVAPVMLGLRTLKDNELVSVMTFSRPRTSLGKSNSSDGWWELSRFCSKLGYSVQGGASKLLTHFRSTHSGNIFSFSDVAHTRGKLYQALGFVQKHITEPSYVWTTLNDSSTLTRVACQKRNLTKLFGSEIDKSKTEKQIMEEHGYARVYDCGVIRWELTV